MSNFIDKTFTVIADILLKVLPASKQEKEAFSYYRAGMSAQSDGKYAQTLFDKFGESRTMDELEDYFSNTFIPRWGFGIGMMRLISAMKHQGLV